MERPSVHANDVAGYDTSPGTVYLYQRVAASRKDHVILEPKPSADPNEPLNWSLTRRIVNFTLTLTVTSMIFTSVTLPPVFWQLWIVDLGATFSQLTNSFAINCCGLAIGCVLFIPLAIKFGRRPVYLVSTFVMLIMAIWQSRMQTVKELYATNFLLGLAGATNETLVQMTVSDLFFVHQRGTADGMYFICVLIGAFMAPIPAGYMAEAAGWRVCYYVLVGFYSLIFILIVFFFEETKYIKLQHAAEQVPTTEQSYTDVEDTGKPVHLEAIERSSQQKSSSPEEIVPEAPLTAASSHGLDHSIPMRPYLQRLRLVTRTEESIWPLYYRPALILVSFPIISYTALQYAFGLCWVSVMVNVIAIVMPYPPYHFGPHGIGLMNLGFLIGAILGALSGGVLSDYAAVKLARRNNGTYEPEMRLHIFHLPILSVPAGLLMFGITLSKHMHFMLPAVGTAILGFGVGCFSGTTLALVIDSYRNIAAEAFIGISFLRNAFSIGLVFGLAPWLGAQGIQNMFIVIAVWAFVVSCLYIPLLIWGKTLRRKTAKRYHKFSSAEGH